MMDDAEVLELPLGNGEFLWRQSTYLVPDRLSGRIDEVFDVMLRSGVESFWCGDRWVVYEHVGETRDLGDGNAMGAEGVIDGPS